jgi:hypothetical protein
MTNQDVCDFLLTHCRQQAASAEKAPAAPAAATAEVATAAETDEGEGGGPLPTAGSDSSLTVASPPMISPTKQSKANAAAAAAAVSEQQHSTNGAAAAAAATSSSSDATTGSGDAPVVGTLSELLLAHCLQKGTMDNCTVVIVDLREAAAPAVTTATDSAAVGAEGVAVQMLPATDAAITNSGAQ